MYPPTQLNHTKVRRLPTFDTEQELQKFLGQNITDSLKQFIKVTVSIMVKAEMEHLRTRLEETYQFNGSYQRNMISTLGKINDIPIPRFRQGIPDDVDLQTLKVFESENEQFAKLVAQMHLLGISQRKIKQLAADCFGIRLSTNRVGAIYKELADQEEVNINRQPLDDDFEFIILDGMWEKTKGYGWDQNQSVLLCALGVRSNGQRKIIGFSIERSENTDSWRKLLTQIKQRGLHGKQLKLAIIDDNQAIKNALAVLYPQLPVQTCIVHKMRNVMSKTSHQHQAKVVEDVKAIFQSDSKDQAMEKAKATIKKWYVSEPSAMASLRFNVEDCFAYFAFAKDQWSKLRTTNILEREFRELRRRMKVFDNTFQNEESAHRYANTLIHYLNNFYPLKQATLHTNT